MLNSRFTAVTTAILLMGCFADSCEAQGPLMNWLRGRSNRHTTYYQGPAATPTPGSCVTTCPVTRYQTVNRVVANYVPYTAFRTEWYRVPVTYYRPVTTSNPRTGCVTTCMRPQMYYQMQARRVPYTTYQTVYRTVQHRVPYTVYETSYGTGCANGTCGVNPAPAVSSSMMPQGAVVQPGVVQPGAMVQQGGVSSYGLNPNSQYVPANTVPQLNPGEIRTDSTHQRPAVTIEPQPDPTVTPENTTKSSHSQPQLNVPANPAPVVDDSNRTASLIRGKWDYSPVRTAAYVDSTSAPQKVEINKNKSAFKPTQPAFRNTGWKSSAK